MADGLRTTVDQFGEIPARFPIQPKTNTAVKAPIARRGSITHFHAAAIVSIQLSRATRGVFAMMRVGNHAGASWTGNVFPQPKTPAMFAMSLLQAVQDSRCNVMTFLSKGLSAFSR